MMIYDYDTTTRPIPTEYKVVLLFWADWHEESIPDGPMDSILKALAESSTNEEIRFGRIHAEHNTDYTNQFHVTSVPTFVILQKHHVVHEVIEGTEDIARITQSVKRLSEASTAAAGNAGNSSNNNGSSSTTATGIIATTKTTTENHDTTDDALRLRLQQLIKSSYVMIFIKGTPLLPKCGFSRQAVTILQEQNIPFRSFDILTDETVRQGLKSYSNWPTYPQIYVNGELIGGLDILKELVEDGNLKEQWNVPDATTAITATKTTIEERCHKLIRQEKIMLFMKGLPSIPRCGFSKRIVEILDDMKIPYGSYDILQDEDVRQTLKIISNWPTYPQLYVNGEFIGGLDIVQELYEDGVLEDTLKG